MKQQIVEFVSMREVRTTYEKKDVYQLRKDRPARWLQKVCLWVLRKLGAYHIVDDVKIERYVIDADNFMSRLYKQQGVLLRLDMDPTHLLIGAEDYAELMREVAATEMLTFRAEYYHGHSIMGMTVHVIPWMRGCLVLPDKALRDQR